jgi:hypothetical protein
MNKRISKRISKRKSRRKSKRISRRKSKRISRRKSKRISKRISRRKYDKGISDYFTKKIIRNIYSPINKYFTKLNNFDEMIEEDVETNEPIKTSSGYINKQENENYKKNIDKEIKKIIKKNLNKNRSMDVKDEYLLRKMISKLKYKKDKEDYLDKIEKVNFKLKYGFCKKDDDLCDGIDNEKIKKYKNYEKLSKTFKKIFSKEDYNKIMKEIREESTTIKKERISKEVAKRRRAINLEKEIVKDLLPDPLADTVGPS